MSPHNVDDGFPSKLREMVGADHGVIVPTPNIIHTRFKFHDIIDERSDFNGPVHTANDAAERKTAAPITAGDLFKRLKHAILVEAAFPEIRFGTCAEFQLAGPHSGVRVNPNRRQATQMIILLVGIYNVHGFVAAVETISDEGKQNTVFFFIAVEKGTNMPNMIEPGAGE